MYKVMAFLTRKSGMSREAFREYYERNHAPLVEALTPKMASYSRNYVNLDEPFKRDESLIAFDVVTEMVFEDRAACESWFASFQLPEVAQQISVDEGKFLDCKRMLVCSVEHEKSQ